MAIVLRARILFRALSLALERLCRFTVECRDGSDCCCHNDVPFYNKRLSGAKVRKLFEYCSLLEEKVRNAGWDATAGGLLAEELFEDDGHYVENFRVVGAVLVLAVIDEEMVGAIVHEVRVFVETDVVVYLLVGHETERHVVDLRQTVGRAKVEFICRECHLAVAAECSRICSRHLSRASIICWNASAYCSGLS